MTPCSDRSRFQLISLADKLINIELGKTVTKKKQHEQRQKLKLKNMWKTLKKTNVWWAR